MSEETLALEVRHVTKRFPGVIANDDVSFTLRKGEIHALLGENGAGKSTLMNVVYGLYSQDEGEFLVDNKVVEINGPSDAINYGIGMVHQHFMLVPVFSVTENMILGSEVTKGTSLDLRRARREILEISKAYGLEVDPDAIVEDIPVGVQQRVEILKALYRKATILVLDEPTAVLTPQEAEDLFRVMRQLTETGVSIIFITHKLKEVLNVADRITVMRRGKVVGHTTPQETDQQGLAAMMVGRDVLLQVEKTPADPGEIVLEVEGLSIEDERGLDVVKNISFEVRTGEILGIAGVAGNGQSELAEVITGLRPCTGSIKLNDVEVANRPPRISIQQGLAHIPEDRSKVGSAPNLSITDNTIMKCYRKDPVGNGWSINFTRARDFARNLKNKYDILAPSVRTPARKLSGGNLQKVILAREISGQPEILVAVQPTRGLDVGAIEAIQTLLLEQREEGAAILLISEELEELFSLSDRIAVVFEGEIMGIVSAEETNIDEIGLMMTGKKLTTHVETA